VYGFFFQLIPIERWMTNAALLPANPDIPAYGGDIIARNHLVYHLQDELYLAMVRAQIFGVRLAILIGDGALVPAGLVPGAGGRPDPAQHPARLRRAGNPPRCTTVPSSSSSRAWPWGRWSI
jgi:hypothetical protein